MGQPPVRQKSIARHTTDVSPPRMAKQFSNAYCPSAPTQSSDSPDRTIHQLVCRNRNDAVSGDLAKRNDTWGDPKWVCPHASNDQTTRGFTNTSCPECDITCLSRSRHQVFKRTDCFHASIDKSKQMVAVFQNGGTMRYNEHCVVKTYIN
jgi:hypothetical protein